MAVKIENGALFIGGREVFLFGGEAQYFRLRDKEFDPSITYGIWADTLDKIAEAGMNLITTYVPWDYHELKEGVFDFDGPRDLDRFLSMCHERNFHVQVKPGPYITAEWPNGPGYFGAVPQWLKDNYPQTLVRTAKGKLFTFGPLPFKAGRQCSYLHPDYIERVAQWYDAVAPIFLKYIHDKPCIWSLQIDNETNFFWTNRHKIDYNPVAIAHYRRFLMERYVDIGALNRRYNSNYRAFDDVEPPRRKPSTGNSYMAHGLANLSENPIFIDWYEAGWKYIKDYLKLLRQMLESKGIKEPDILFATNDTPAIIPVMGDKLLFWRGSMKNQAGLPTLDSYPRCNPFGRQLDDVPFQTDSFIELMDFYGDSYPMKDGRWVMGAEMQGGVFDTPVLKLKVRPEATARQVTKALGSGVKAYAVFVLRQGYNKNNTIYRFQAAIDEKGRTNERFDVLRKAARNMALEHGHELNRARPVHAPIAVIANSDYQIPLSGVKIDSLSLWDKSYGGAYGWLKRAGYIPHIVDIKDISRLEPAKFKAALYIDPGLMGAREADMLTDYMETGGTLIHVGWPSDADLAGKTGPSHHRFRQHFPSRYCGAYRKGNRLTFFNNGVRYDFRSRADVFVWELPKEARTLLKIPQGGWASCVKSVGAGRLVYISSNFTRSYNTDYLYKMTEGEHLARALFAREIMGLAGVERPLDWSPLKVEVWASKAPGGKLFIFCLNDGPATEMNVKHVAPKRLGLEPSMEYRVKRIYEDREIARLSGNQLITEGVSLQLVKWGSEALLIEPL